MSTTKEIAIARPADIAKNVIVISSEVIKAKTSLLKKSKSIKEVTEKNHKKASDLFAELHSTMKMFDNNRKEATTPLQNFKTAIINLVKPHSAELEEEKRALAGKIHTYEKEVARKAEEERLAKEKKEREEREAYDRKVAEEKARAEAAQDFPDLPDEPEPEPEPVAQKPAIVSKIKVKKLWKLKIVEVEKIPLMYLVPDEVAIRNAFKSGKKVPGCTWKQEESVGAK